jgi:hypothetical protein
MSEGEVYCIVNLERYATHLRRNAAESFTERVLEETEQDLESYVTNKQMMSLVEESSIGKDKEGRILLDDKSYENLFEKVRTRIYNAGLSKLAAKDMLQCAWDDKINQMVFWSEESEES